MCGVHFFSCKSIHFITLFISLRTLLKLALRFTLHARLIGKKTLNGFQPFKIPEFPVSLSVSLTALQPYSQTANLK